MRRRELISLGAIIGVSGCSKLPYEILDRSKIERYTTGEDLWISPTIVNDVVVVGHRFRLFGISNDFGSKTWTRTLSANRLHRIAGKPARNDGTVFATGNVANKATVFALDADSGSFDWKLDLAEERVYPPVLDRFDPETLLVRTATGLHGITTDGRRLWTIGGLPRETVVGPLFRNLLTPGEDERFYYVTSQTEVLAIDRTRREVAWRVTVDEPWTPPASDDERVYVPGGSEGLLAVEKDTGETVWQIREELSDGPIDSRSSHRRPIVDEDAIYANVGDYHVSFGKTGEINWTTKLGGGIASGPVSFGDANYVSGKHLYEIDKQTGEKRVIIRGLDTPLTPTVSNESLFVSGRKTLYKYGL